MLPLSAVLPTCSSLQIYNWDSGRAFLLCWISTVHSVLRKWMWCMIRKAFMGLVITLWPLGSFWKPCWAYWNTFNCCLITSGVLWWMLYILGTIPMIRGFIFLCFLNHPFTETAGESKAHEGFRNFKHGVQVIVVSWELENSDYYLWFGNMTWKHCRTFVAVVLFNK